MSSGESDSEKAAEEAEQESEELMEQQEQQAEDLNKSTMTDQLTALKRFSGGGASGGTTDPDPGTSSNGTSTVGSNSGATTRGAPVSKDPKKGSLGGR